MPTAGWNTTGGSINKAWNDCKRSSEKRFQTTFCHSPPNLKDGANKRKMLTS
ncbi:hypothetical protein HMPREF1051_2995 [Neisseria sicca VK64]|uniref:Uncharacterized protein n=1 Tax=Neisseria sicca VK64 TaxID=1095748 RepID=I2NGE4_NEISI|nr:hypothetical protein HMPREF1051_2995 [Neisseria sicca VK64]